MVSRMLLAATAALTLSLPLSVSAPAFAHDYKAGEIAIGHPWTRATPPNAPVGGAYMILDNRGSDEDRLIGGSTPVADEVQIHEMGMADGVMTMRQVKDGLNVPAGETVTLEPGGYHFMLMGLNEPLTEESRVPLTLRFEKAGDVEVELAVEPTGARTSGGDGGHDSMDHGSAE